MVCILRYSPRTIIDIIAEYLAITGSGIKTVKITKKAYVWPLQRVRSPFVFSVSPAS